MTTTELSKKDKLIATALAADFSNEGQAYKTLREEARKELEAIELPTSKTEYWKYTRLGKITNTNFELSKIENIDFSSFLIPQLDANIIVVVNGFFHHSLSKITEQHGITVSSLIEAKKNNFPAFSSHFNQYSKNKNELFLAFNNAFHTDGVFIVADNNQVSSKPYHIINITTSNKTISQSRNLFVANQGSNLKIIESFVNNKGSENFNNHVTEIFVDENSSLEYNKVQEKTEQNYSISTEQVHQKANSNFSINTATFDGALVRNNLTIEVDASNCETNLSGLYLARNKDHIDNHSIVDHKKPYCNSFEVYKGVLDNDAVGVFNGKVFVRQQAQKTNAFQQNNNILLSDNSVAYSKPELEIYADDVKCSHGSTTGQIDDEAIFYLQSRGINKKSALKLMISAFAKDALEKISIDAFHEYINSKIEQRFE